VKEWPSGQRACHARLLRRRQARVRPDAFSTRYKISSNRCGRLGPPDRPNDRSWMTGLGRLARDGVVTHELPNRRTSAGQSQSSVPGF
jgi:hypothetical protein